MLEIGSFKAAVCQGMTRRAFVRAGLMAPAAWAMSTTMPAPAVEARKRAKSVLVLWLWGAPSHLDTFDPKPNAPAEYRGPFSTIATKTPGVRISELLQIRGRQRSLYAHSLAQELPRRASRSRNLGPDRI